jgi:hypothetical protein
MLHMKMLMIVTISMILEVYFNFYDDSNACYIPDYIDMYYVLLLIYNCVVYIIFTFIYGETIQLISCQTDI